MALVSGARLGPYEIQSPLGAGGMGEVYRARDTRLGREVAVKVLPAAFSREPERLRRFQQEAQAVATLNHPNILAIHDFGEHDGLPYIVTELLEGETLRGRVQAGSMPVRKATEIAEQIARGLAAAHDKGIVHRDLKPENIFITRDGRVKILDFGLAKLAPEAVTPDSATLASRTEPGVVVGTVGYMSPEQVRGQATDHRSDLFSFGTILYEMLSGKRAFHGDTSVEIMNAILKQEPAEDADSGRIPPPLSRIIGHCLEKNPAERFQSARDVAFALGAPSGSVSASTTAVKVESTRAWWPLLRIAMEVTLLAAVIILSWLLARHTSEAPSFPMLSSILPPPGDGFWANETQPAAISPDGKFLAVIAMRNGHSQLWLGRHDSSGSQPISGSEDAANPFWSPDSRYIGFFAGTKLKKVDVAGGAVTDICTPGYHSMGGSWSSGRVILFSVFGQGLKRVPDGGGTPEPVPGLAISADAVGQYWPAFLPDGKHFFYLEWGYPRPASHDNTVWIGSLDGEKPQPLPLTSTNVQYASGYLVFNQDGDLFAQEFDPARLQLKGTARPVARNIEFDTFFQVASFTASNNGILVYGPAGTGINSELTWMDRNGNVLGVLGDPGEFERQAISPEGKRVAVGVKPSGPPETIWIYDVDRGTRVPLISDETSPVAYSPRWSPDGNHVAYRTLGGKTTSALEIRAADGSGEKKQIGPRDEGVVTVQDWSPDGRYLAFNVLTFLNLPSLQSKLYVRRLEEGAKPELEINGASEAKFSPDGHWLAYSDDNSGELFVTPFPGPGARIAVSSKGGSDPRWRGDGQELFYLTDDQDLISVQVRESQKEFLVLSAQRLFHIGLPDNAGFYDVTRDGKRFLVNIRTHKEQSAPLTVVTNWPALVQNETK
jgi:eukaryotic-like serine/threonine-protein kinase